MVAHTRLIPFDRLFSPLCKRGAGGDSSGNSSLYGLKNDRQYRLRFRQHLPFIEAQHTDSVRLQPGIPVGVVYLLYRIVKMLAAIHLHRQTGLRGVEIQDVSTQRTLTVKAHAELVTS